MNTRISTTRPAIGEAFGGGFFAGLIRIGSSTYGLIVAPKPEGETTGEWGAKEPIDGALSFFDGQANTQAMATAGSSIAAWAQGLNIGDQSDWYIPARDELEVIYRAVKPTDDDNVCWCGDNPSSYLPTYAYSPEIPAKTSVEAFQDDAEQAFTPSWYWSSTQFAGNASLAWTQDFGDGLQYHDGKGYKARVRAVRRIYV